MIDYVNWTPTENEYNSLQGKKVRVELYWHSASVSNKSAEIIGYIDYSAVNKIELNVNRIISEDPGNTLKRGLDGKLFMPNGAKGNVGAKGDKGDIGLTGPAGPQGIQGPIGKNSFVPGPKGDKGDKGDIGLTGSQGIQGPIGLTGARGLEGPKGAQGIQGPIGIQGIQGPIGLTGLTGAKGDKGDKGDKGLTGPKGDNALQRIFIQSSDPLVDYPYIWYKTDTDGNVIDILIG